MAKANDMIEIKNMTDGDGKPLNPKQLNFEMDMCGEVYKVNLKQDSSFLDDNFTVQDDKGNDINRGKDYKGWTYVGKTTNSKGIVDDATFTLYTGIEGMMIGNNKRPCLIASVMDADCDEGRVGILPVKVIKDKEDAPNNYCGVKK